MRSLFMVLIAFGAGFLTALSVDSKSVDHALHSILQFRAFQSAAQDQPQGTRPAPSGDERYAVDARGHVETYADIDGREMQVLVDTGASMVSLRESDARRAGYRLQDADFTVAVNTANGRKYAAPITLREVQLGDIRVRDVEALVSRDDQLSINLLGMSFLSRLDGFRFEGRELILEN